MNEEQLQSIFNQYKSVNPNVTEEMFNTSYNLLGDQYVQIIQDELKKKVDPQEQEILSETQIDSNSINSATPNVLATPISNDLQLNQQQVEILNQQQPQTSTVLDSIGNQSLLVSEFTSPSSSNIDLKEISEPVLNPTQVIPDFNNIVKPKNNALEVLAGKETTTSTTNNLPIPTLEQVEADKQAKTAEEIKTAEFLKQYSDKDYLNAKIPFVEKGIEYTSWSTTPEQVKESNDRLVEAERNGDVYLKAGENGGIAKDERGNYKYEILTDSYKDKFNQYINDLNSVAGQENINRARFNQGNIFNTPEQSESVEYLNSLQKEYGIVFTNDQVDQLTNPNARKQLEINLETERRLKENPNLDYNTVLQQVTSEKQGLSEQQKFSVGNSYVRDFFLESPENYADDEKDEYRFYQNYFSNQNNIAEFGDFMNDYGKAVFDTSWIKSNQTKKEQERRKEMFETFLSWKGKNDRLDLELSQRGFENTKAKADGYKKSNNQEAYQQEIPKMNDYLNTYNQSFDKLKSRNEEFQNIQNNYSKTLKQQEEKANFQLRVQSGEASANIQNVVGNVVLGAETSIQNAVTGILRIAAIPLGKGNVNDAIDILSKPISIGNVDIARISDRVVNYEKGDLKYKEVNGTLYGINSDGSLYRPKQNISRENLVKTGEDAEYNVSGIAFVTSKMLADIYITQRTGTAIGGTLGKISNAVSNSQKINAVFGEASQLSKLAASYTRMAQNPTSVMVNGWTVQMYNDNYLAAQNGGIESTLNKHLYAFTASFALAQIQRINPDINFIKGIYSEQKAIVSHLLEGNTQRAILGIQSFATKAAKNTGKELVEENVQQATQDIINTVVNSVADKNLRVSDVQDYKDVFVGTVIPSIIASGLGGRVRQAEVGGRNIDLTQLTRNELVTELARTEEGIALLQNFKENAFFDSQKVEADNILNEVKERQKYINKIPDSENYSTETINQVIPLLQEIDAKKAKLNSTEETFKDRLSQEISSISTEVNSLLDNDKNNEQPEVTTQPAQESEAIQEQAPIEINQPQQVETPATEANVNLSIEEINNQRDQEINNYQRPFSFEDFNKTEAELQQQDKVAIDSINAKYDAQIQNLQANNQAELTPVEQANIQIERLQQLPLTNEADYNEAQSIINSIDFNNEESISDGISRLGNLVSGKDLSKTKTTAEKYIQGKEKQIGNIDTRTKEYLDFYVNTIYRDFSNNPNFFNETAQNNQNLTEQATTEAPTELGNQTNDTIENIQATESQNAQAPQSVQIDETIFNDNTDLTEEQLIESDKQVSDAISLFESFNATISEAVTENSRLSSNGKYNIVERISENGNTTFNLLDNSNNPVSLTNKQKDVYIAEYINSKEYPATEIDLTGDLQPNELTQEIIRNTQDPKELAQIIVSTPQFDSQSVVGSKDWAISQVIGKNNVSRESFIQNDDANNITNAIGRTYFGKNKTGKSLDNIAQEASEQFTADYNGESVTIQDVVDFIKSYPNDPSKAERPNNPLYDEAVSKFIQLTGQNPTKNLLDKLIPAQNVEDIILNLQSAESEYNNLTAEQQDQLSQEYDNWFNSLSNEQKQQELNKRYPDYEQINRQSNIQSENQSTPNAEGESNQNVGNEGSAQRQQTNESLATISESEFNSLTEQLKKPFKNAFKNLNVTTNLEEATQRARELGENTTDLEFTNANDNVYGFKLSDGTIYINPANLNANTPIHEFSHLWEQLMPNAWRNGLVYFKDTATGKRIFNQLKSEGNYSNLTDDQIWSEALNTHIGNYGEWINNNPKGKMKEFADWIKRTFAKIGNYFGIKTNPETSLRNFTEGVVGQLLGGRELVSESNQQIKQNEELKKYLKDKLKLPQNLIDALPKDLSITYKILMGNPSMSLTERLKQTRSIAAQTELNNLQIFAKDGNINIDKIGTIRANLLITLKYYLTGSNRKNTDIFHEVVHAGTLLTMKDLEFYKKNSKYRDTNKYTKEQIEAYDNILFNAEYFKDLYKDNIKIKPFGVSLYGLTNEYEFIAEFMSNPKFKQWILDNSNNVNKRENLQKSGKIEGGILRNLWDNIKILLGIKNKEIDKELENEINNDINFILDAQKNNLENFVSFNSDINPAETGIQFSKGNINKNVIPKTTFAKVVNATSTEGRQAGFNELINSSWFNGLTEAVKSNTTVDNFHNLMLDQAKLIQENDALKKNELKEKTKQLRESKNQEIKEVKQKSREKIQEKNIEIKDLKVEFQNKIKELRDNYKNKLKTITDAKERLSEKIFLRKEASIAIKTLLNNKSLREKITYSELKSLLSYADTILSTRDINNAFDNFQNKLDTIIDKAEQRSQRKEEWDEFKQNPEALEADPNATYKPVTGRNVLVKFKEKWFANQGGLLKPFLGLKDNAKGSINWELRIARNVIKGLQKEQNKLKFNSEENNKEIDNALKGNLESFNNLPDSIKPFITEMRNQVDGLSNYLIDNNLVTANQALNIQENLGSYITRGYDYFDGKTGTLRTAERVSKQFYRLLFKKQGVLKSEFDADKWADAVTTYQQNILNDIAADKKFNNKAKYGEDFHSQSEADIQSYARTEGESKLMEYIKSLEAEYQKSGSAQKADTSVLKERQNVPEPIRRLLGEYEDPKISFALTISRMSQLAYQRKFMSQLREMGMGTLFFEENDPNKPGTHYVKIASDTNDSYAPLSGLYTTPEFKDVFLDVTEQNINDIGRLWMKATGFVKVGKTVLSPVTQMVNFFANPGFLINNGTILDVKQLGASIKVFADDMKGSVSTNPLLQELIEENIIDQNIMFNEIESDFGANVERDLVRNIRQNTSVKTLRDMLSIPFRAYKASDDFFKAFTYYAEADRYAKAIYNKKYKQLEGEERTRIRKIASEATKNTMPNYDRRYKAADFARMKTGNLLGNFLSFQAESLRTKINSVQIAISDIKNPETRSVGIQRMAGIVTYNAIYATITSILGKASGLGLVGLLGFFDDDDEDEKNKSFNKTVPEWARSTEKFVKKENDGTITFYTYGNSNPYGIWYKTVNAYQNGSGNNASGGLLSVMDELATPFFGTEMSAQWAVNTFVKSENDWGSDLVTWEDKARYSWEKLSPTAFKVYKDNMDENDKNNFDIYNALGIKKYNFDPTQQLGFKFRDWQTKINDIGRKKYTLETQFQNGKISEKDALAIYKEYTEEQTEITDEFKETYEAFIKWGADVKNLNEKANRSFEFKFNSSKDFLNYLNTPSQMSSKLSDEEKINKIYEEEDKRKK